MIAQVDAAAVGGRIHAEIRARHRRDQVQRAGGLCRVIAEARHDLPLIARRDGLRFAQAPDHAARRAEAAWQQAHLYLADHRRAVVIGQHLHIVSEAGVGIGVGQQMVPVEEQGLTLAVDEEAPALGLNHLPDGLGGADALSPGIAHVGEDRSARLQTARDRDSRQARVAAQLTVIHAPQHPDILEPRPAQRQCVQNLVDYLVGADIDLGWQANPLLGEGPGGINRINHRLARPVVARLDLDTLDLSAEMGANGRAVIALDLQALARLKRGDLRRIALLPVTQANLGPAWLGHKVVRLRHPQPPVERQYIGADVLAAEIAVVVPVNVDAVADRHHATASSQLWRKAQP